MNNKQHFFEDQQHHALAFAEVVSSSLEHFSAQCWDWDKQPSFGSLVTVRMQHLTLFGCVTQVTTGSLDPMRVPTAYKKTEEQLRAEQPQIFEFLTTHFEAQIVGYIQHQQPHEILYMLPPLPSKIHAFVTACSPAMGAHFYAKNDYLHLLFAFQAKLINLDELLLAILAKQVQQGVLTKELFNAFCQTYAMLNGNDYRRTKLLLQRAANFIQGIF